MADTIEARIEGKPIKGAREFAGDGWRSPTEVYRSGVLKYHRTSPKPSRVV